MQSRVPALWRTVSPDGSRAPRSAAAALATPERGVHELRVICSVVRLRPPKASCGSVCRARGRVPFFLVRRDGVETLAPVAPVAPVAFRQDTARRLYGGAPGGLTGPLFCRWQDRWLKSWCPSGDVIARVTSLPRVDLIKRIVPAGRLRFICLLILTCLHKSSPWSRASLLITVNRTPRAVPGPVRVPSAGSTVILNEPASPEAVSCTPALCAKWEGSCLSRIRSTVGSKAGEF